MKYIEVRNLPAGEETDNLIAKKIMGWKKRKYYGDLDWRNKDGEDLYSVSAWKPSRNTEQAIEALEMRCKYIIDKDFSGKYIVKTWVNEFAGARVGEADTLALAACRSLLLWEAEL